MISQSIRDGICRVIAALLISSFFGAVSGTTNSPPGTMMTAVINSSVVFSGTDLYCYECMEKYDSSFDPSQSPCLTNLSQITVRQCSPGNKYCQVQRTTYDRLGFVLTISRGCVNSCIYGCQTHMYGPGQLVCTSCCRSPGCNSGNSATPSITVSGLGSYANIAVFTVVALLVTSDGR